MHILVRGGSPNWSPLVLVHPSRHPRPGIRVLGVHALVVAPRDPLDGVCCDLLAADLRLQRDVQLPLPPGHLGEEVSEPAGHSD